jgi:energy-coupling factor transport system substrate-specific component
MATSSSQRATLGLTTMAWILIPVGVGINLVGHFIAQTLRLPIFLDVIGTILVGVLAGPWAGAIAGLVTNVVAALILTPTWLPYAIVNILIGIAAGYLARGGWFRDVPRTVVSGFIIAVIGVVSSAPITAYVYGGVTGAGEDVIRAYLYATGQNLLQGALTASAITEPVDKILSALIVYVVINNLPRRYRERFRPA